MDALNRKQKIYFAIASLVFAVGTSAAEVNINSGIKSEYINQTIDDVENSQEIDSDNWKFSPYLSANYNAKLLNFNVIAEHNHIRRSLESESVTSNYTNYSGNIGVNIIPNLLRFSGTARQGYRGIAANSFIVDDFLLNANNLAKTNSYRTAIQLSLPARSYVGVDSTISYSSFKSGLEDGNNILAFDNEQYLGQVSLLSGRDFRPFSFQLQGRTSLVKRSQREDFSSSSVAADLRAPMFTPGLMFTVVLNYENNEIDNDALEVSTLREFYSYGAGLTWQVARNKLIQLTWNTSNTEARADEDDETESFLGGRIDWQFTPRTELQAQFTRRFFGDAATVAFTHNSKHLRNRISYTETVLTNPQLLQNNEIGLFACDGGSTDIADCELLDTINQPSIPPGTVLIPFVETTFELNDSVIIRKNAQFTSAIQRRRTNIALTVMQSNDEDVERNTETTTDSVQLTSSIKLTPKTTIRTIYRYADVNRLFNGEDLNSKTNEISLNIERRFTRQLRASVGYRYLDRSGTSLGDFGGNFSGINGPLTDNRITASLRYQFSQK